MRLESSGSDVCDTGTFFDWFTQLPGRSTFYTSIPLSYIEDDFNLYDMQTIPDWETLHEIVLQDEWPLEETIEEHGEELVKFYELLHQKYILTKPGLHDMVP